MKIFKQYIVILVLMLLNLVGKAQDLNPNKVEMADLLHQNGKIYLVVLVLVTIFAGIIFLLVRIERKLNKLENKKSNN
jgi:uncharacterized membrane protein YkvI